MAKQPSMRHFVTFLGKEAFTNIRAALESLESALSESDQILAKNLLPKFSDRSPSYKLWDNDISLWTQTSVQLCFDTIADKDIFVLDQPLCVATTIGAEALSDLIQDQKSSEDIFLYLPGWAVMILSRESRNYDKISLIRCQGILPPSKKCFERQSRRYFFHHFGLAGQSAGKVNKAKKSWCGRRESNSHSY